MCHREPKPVHYRPRKTDTNKLINHNLVNLKITFQFCNEVSLFFSGGHITKKKNEENLTSWTELYVSKRYRKKRECSGASYGSARVSLHISQ